VFYAGMHGNVLRTRTRHPATMDDPQYWHARSVAAVCARWSDVIAPVCTEMRAGNKFVKSKPLTGMVKLDLLAMTGLWRRIMTEVEDMSPPRLLGLLEPPRWGPNALKI